MSARIAQPLTPTPAIPPVAAADTPQLVDDVVTHMFVFARDAFPFVDCFALACVNRQFNRCSEPVLRPIRKHFFQDFNPNLERLEREFKQIDDNEVRTRCAWRMLQFAVQRVGSPLATKDLPPSALMQGGSLYPYAREVDADSCMALGRLALEAERYADRFFLVSRKHGILSDMTVPMTARLRLVWTGFRLRLAARIAQPCADLAKSLSRLDLLAKLELLPTEGREMRFQIYESLPLTQASWDERRRVLSRCVLEENAFSRLPRKLLNTVRDAVMSAALFSLPDLEAEAILRWAFRQFSHHGKEAPDFEAQWLEDIMRANTCTALQAYAPDWASGEASAVSALLRPLTSAFEAVLGAEPVPRASIPRSGPRAQERAVQLPVCWPVVLLQRIFFCTGLTAPARERLLSRVEVAFEIGGWRLMSPASFKAMCARLAQRKVPTCSDGF